MAKMAMTLESIKSPQVVFITLNWNQLQMTTECMQSLLALDYPNFRIVVVDNGSTDGSSIALRERFPQIVIVENDENQGYSEGNNVGIHKALDMGAEYIFLLNNDTAVDPTMLSTLMQVAEQDPRVGMVGPTMYYSDPGNTIWGGRNSIDWRGARVLRHGLGEPTEHGKLSTQAPEQVDYIDSCALLVKREVVERIGLMSGRYFINFDDLDWNVRAHRAGYKIVYVPSARIWHKVSAAMGWASPATTYYTTRNSLVFFWSHSPGIWKFVALITIALRTLRTITAWSLKREYQTEAYRRKRNANLLALRDFFLSRLGKMDSDVALVCYGH